MTETLAIRLLGGFSVRVDDAAVEEGAWRLRKARSLVKILALAPEHALHRDRAIELLWPDRDPASAANNLHQALYVARRALGTIGADGAAALPMRDETVLLCPDDPVWVDVTAFEAAVARAREAPGVASHREALELYGGELLPEDRYEEWAVARRDALRELHLGLLVELAELYADAGEHAFAIEVLQRAVVEDPLHEGATRKLMRAFAAAGRPQQALAQYERLRVALRAAYEADPDAETRRLYRELLASGVDLAPAGAAPERSAAPATNLPLRATTFIGREREVAAALGALERTRALTLSGPGGCGKTRLALEVAGARARTHAVDTWLVELAALSEPSLVAQAVAEGVGVQLPGDAPPAEALAAALGDGELLLVLDNCEHLIEACAELVDELLRRCPGVVVLATSREPLQVAGEIVWRVPSLALPDRAIAAPGEAARYAAVRLFSERAADADPDFSLDEDNLAAVVEVCHRLDGMPLAIELAAARAAVLSPAQMAERLSDALAVLTTGPRATPTRRQTLRATLEWSHALLTDDERVLFRRVGVFAGSFSLDAAEGVCDGNVDVLGRLVDKSLVAVERHEREHRFRLLEVIRQYATELMREVGELDAVKARHRAWFVALAERADPELATDARLEQPPDRLEVEHDNLRAALGSALSEDPEVAQRLAASMWRFWLARGHFVEGARWIDAALERGGQTGRLRGRILIGACALGVRRGNQTRIVEMAEEAAAIYGADGDPRATMSATNFAAMMAWSHGDFDRADKLCAQGLELATGEATVSSQAMLTHTLALMAYSRGHDDEARRRFEETLEVLGRVPASQPPFFPATAIGLVVLVEGALGRPRCFFEETVFAFRRVGVEAARAYAQANLAALLRVAGRPAEAEPLLDECLARFQRLEDRLGVPFALNQLGCLARTTGDLDLGRARIEEALALAGELGEHRPVGMALGSLALLHGRAGDAAGARTRIAEALRRFEAADDAPGLAGMLDNLGVVELDDDQPDRAVDALERSHRLWERQHLPRATSWTLLMLADALALAGDAEAARERYDDAARWFGRLLDERGSAAVAAVAESPLSAC